MKKLEDLKPTEGSKEGPQRLGRGYSSGTGGHESGRGTKGQRARSGGKPKVGFEGGQTPIWRRFPKRGFTNPNKRHLQWINLYQLERYSSGETITPDRLLKEGLIDGIRDGLKVLGKGDLSTDLTVKAHDFSSGARRQIEEAGGKCILIAEETEE
ncbi:MAG: 50S ribosomal protein L15 [Candidatus Acetothermia bacterium]